MSKALRAGAGAKMQYLVHRFNDNTIRFLVRYPGLIDPGALKCAARALVDSVEVLHASFHPGVFGACWQVSHSCEDDCFFRALSADGDPLPQAIDLALQPVRPSGKAQLMCGLVRNDHESILTLTLSHLCVDGGDGKYLLFKLIEAYNLFLAAGSCKGLSVKQGSRSVRQLYQSLSPGQFLSLMRDPRTGVKSVCPFPTEEEGFPQLIHASIPAPVMASARQHAKAAGATVNDLLLAACYHAYASLPGVDRNAPMSIMSMLDLRRHCPGKDSAGLSNLSGSLPTCLPEGIGDSFDHTLSEIASQTRRQKSDPLAGLAGMPLLHIASDTMALSILERIASRLYGSMAVGLTNLGNIDGQRLRMGDIAPASGWFAGPSKNKPGMQVSAVSFDGALSLCIAGRYAADDASMLQSMLDCMVDLVCAYAGITSF